MMDTLPTDVTLNGVEAVPDFGSFATLRMTFPELA
jgi:hypothetical protein